MKLNEKVMDFLKNNKVWNIATYGEDGAHVVPCFHTAVLDGETLVAVSYTHLTLPTNREV